MEKLKLYVVTKSSSDNWIKVADLVWVSENGDLNNATQGGWLSESEWKRRGTNDFEIEVCKTHCIEVIRGREMVRKLCGVDWIIK